MLVPGSGEPNFDSYVADPYQRARARQEQEVHQLMDKLQPDMIVVDPTTIGQVSCWLCSSVVQLNRGACDGWRESLLISAATLACLSAGHACATKTQFMCAGSVLLCMALCTSEAAWHCPPCFAAANSCSWLALDPNHAKECVVRCGKHQAAMCVKRQKFVGI